MNLPNKLSFIRIALVPLMMFFYLADFIPYCNKIIALVIFIIAAVTDLFDGKIARKRNEVTDLGKLLDPLADKMLYTCAFFLLIADSSSVIIPWVGVIALTVLFVRDSLVNGIRQIAASKGVVVAAAPSGKLKSVLTYIYIPMIMFLNQGLLTSFGIEAFNVINLILLILAYVVMGFGTLVTLYSGVDYTLRNKSAIMGEKTKEDEGEVDREESEEVKPETLEIRPDENAEIDPDLEVKVQ